MKTFRTDTLLSSLRPSLRFLTFCALVASVLSGCVGRSIGRSIGAGAVETVKNKDTALVALERRLLDSAQVYLSEAVQTAVIEPMRAQADSLSDVAQGATDSVTLLLAHRIRTELNESMQQLLQENMDVLDERGSKLSRRLARDLVRELHRKLPGALARVGDTLGKQMIAGMAVGIREVLDPTLHAMMLDITDSLLLRIREVDTTFAESKTIGGLRYTIYGMSVVFAITLGFVVVGYWRRQSRALNVLIDAAVARGDPQLHESISSCANEAGVHGWLTDRISSRRRGKRTGEQK